MKKNDIIFELRAFEEQTRAFAGRLNRITDPELQRRVRNDIAPSALTLKLYRLAMELECETVADSMIDREAA